MLGELLGAKRKRASWLFSMKQSVHGYVYGYPRIVEQACITLVDIMCSLVPTSLANIMVEIATWFIESWDLPGCPRFRLSASS